MQPAAGSSISLMVPAPALQFLNVHVAPQNPTPAEVHSAWMKSTFCVHFILLFVISNLSTALLAGLFMEQTNVVGARGATGSLNL